MLRAPAIILVGISVAFLILALRRLSVRDFFDCNKDLRRKSLILRGMVALIMLCFCVMAVQFIREGNRSDGFREDLFGAAISIFISAFVYVAAGITRQTAHLFNELGSMRTLAHRDALTGLFNRRYFDTALAKAIEFSKFAGEPLALIAIDIDSLKQVNDQHGHAFGDEVIRRVCVTISGASRARDAVVRLGGDELMIISQGTDHAAAVLFADRVRHLVERIEFCPQRGGVFNVSISAGTANHRRNEEAADLISRADAAMYRSKIGGRNRVHHDRGENTLPMQDEGFAGPRLREA